MSTVSIQKTVRITPGVLAAGGSALVLSGLLLTGSTRVPIGTLLQLTSTLAVQNYFGEDTLEARAAAVYFGGFQNSNRKPAKMCFAQYNTANVGAYLRGGDISDYTLTQLQAISGSLSITLDGVAKSGNPNLSGATSFSNAAQIIGAANDIYGPNSASFTGAISGTTLTASSVTGAIDIGGKLGGAGITAGTYIKSQLTGTPGGAGTYQVSASQTVASEAMTSTLAGVTYDSVSGAFKIISPTTGNASTSAFATGTIAGDLKLTQATGAVLSQGADAATPAAFMNNLIQQSRAFASFTLAFNPDDVGETDVRFAFAQWNASQPSRFCYVATDSDEAPTTSDNATSSLGNRIKAADIGGTIVNWQLDSIDPLDYANTGAFTMGIGASIDFTQANGRVTFDARRPVSGVTVSVDDDTVHDNLLANGYNFYEVQSDGDEEWRWYTNGSISGDFRWADSYFNQIALNSGFTRDLANLLQNAFSIPYNAAGRTLIESALADTIEQFLNFGAYRAGVTLSSQQIADVNNRAQKDIASVLTTQGWYLDVGVAPPEVRQERGSPPMTFYYVDGQSVQQFDMASIVLL
jgi:hypothetical protein